MKSSHFLKHICLLLAGVALINCQLGAFDDIPDAMKDCTDGSQVLVKHQFTNQYLMFTPSGDVRILDLDESKRQFALFTVDMFRENAQVKYALKSVYNGRYLTYVQGDPNVFKSVADLSDAAKFVYSEKNAIKDHLYCVQTNDPVKPFASAGSNSKGKLAVQQYCGDREGWYVLKQPTSMIAQSYQKTFFFFRFAQKWFFSWKNEFSAEYDNSNTIYVFKEHYSRKGWYYIINPHFQACLIATGDVNDPVKLSDTGTCVTKSPYYFDRDSNYIVPDEDAFLFQVYLRKPFDVTEQLFFQGDYYWIRNSFGQYMSYRNKKLGWANDLVESYEEWAVVLKRSKIYSNMNGMIECVPFQSGYFYLQTLSGQRGFLSYVGEFASFETRYDGYSAVAPVNVSPDIKRTIIALAETKHVIKSNKGGYVTSVNAVRGSGSGQVLAPGNGKYGPGLGQHFELFEDPPNSGKYYIQTQANNGAEDGNYLDGELQEVEKAHSSHFRFHHLSFDFKDYGQAPEANQFRDVPASLITILSQIKSSSLTKGSSEARIQSRIASSN